MTAMLHSIITASRQTLAFTINFFKSSPPLFFLRSEKMPAICRKNFQKKEKAALLAASSKLIISL
jgi:hypothetical protein